MKKQPILRFGIMAIVAAHLLSACQKDHSASHAPFTAPALSMQTNGNVQTPYGWVPASRVHQVDNQTIVREIGGHLQTIDIASGKMIRDLGALSPEDLSSKNPYTYAAYLRGATTLSASNAIRPAASLNASRSAASPNANKLAASTNASKSAASGTDFPGYFISFPQNNIQSFTTTWIVPALPLDTNANDIITTFIWNGIDGGALQPVLQYDEGYGNMYTIANWYFTDGNYFHGTMIPVAVGTKLTGVITYVSNNDSTWTYTESFTGYPQGNVTVVRASEATDLCECYEPYTSLLSLWPNQAYVAMSNIAVTLRSGTPPATVTWSGADDGPRTTPSGYNSVIVNASSSNGLVDFYFGDGTGITPDSTFQLISGVDGASVLDITGGRTANGTKVELWSDNSPISTNQEWIPIAVGNGYYELQAVNAPTRALTVTGGSSANGTQAEIYTYSGASSQLWTITPVGGGYNTLAPACAPSSRLDVNGGSNAPGTKVQIWSADGGNSQMWKFAYVPQPVN